MVHFEIDELIPQIEASWNKWAKTKEAREHFGGRTPPTTFAKGETPWTTKQSVLERNYFWANKLIALYIELNVDVADRWPVWKFFEIRPSGVVSCVKDQISRLKRAEKAIKTAKKLAVKASKQAAKVAMKKIAKVEKAKAKAIAKVEKAKAKAIAKEAAKNIAKVEKAKAKADKTIATLKNKSLGFIKWCVANDVSIEDAIKMVQASM